MKEPVKKEADGILDLMRRKGIPLTRENYLRLNFGNGDVPEGPEFELTLPKQFRKK